MEINLIILPGPCDPHSANSTSVAKFIRGLEL